PYLTQQEPHVRRQGHRPPRRQTGPAGRAGKPSRTHDRRTQRHLPMGGDAGRGQCGGRAAHDQCRGPAPQVAGGQDLGRRPGRRSDGECAGRRGALLRRAEGGRVMSELVAMTLAEARDAIRAKKISSRELTGAFVKAIESARPLNAFLTEAGEQALLAADAADRRIAEGKIGALEGLPLAIKDLFCTKGTRTTAASKILGNFVPPY